MTAQGVDELGVAMDLLTRIAAGETPPPADSTGTNEKETALVVGLNMLAEELDARRTQQAEREKRRVDEHLERERKLSAQLAQAHKLQSVNQASAGLVHDFNNVLGIILNSVAYLRAEDSCPPAFARELAIIEQAAARGADLSRQLMSLSRQDSATNAQPLDLGQVVRANEPMLRRLLRGRISLAIETPEQELLARIRASQLMQVVVNLVVNARDAIPDDGHIVIRVEKTLGPTNGSSNPHAVVGVTDDGEGMPSHVLEQAFEPFFTSKPEGEGTGLGLSICRDIVAQAGGHVTLDSEPGRGTSVRVLLPLYQKS